MNLFCVSLKTAEPLHCLTAGSNHINIIKGWKQLQHQEGYLNECTGQLLVVEQKQYSLFYHAVVFEGQRKRNSENKGRAVSPEFETEAKAEAYAVKLMSKNPDGIKDKPE